MPTPQLSIGLGNAWRQPFARFYVVGVLVFVGISPGCSQRGPGVKLVRVEGRVTFEGKPVTKGTVMFMPGGHIEGPMHPASGEIAADGGYHVSTFAKGDGVAPGEYQVAIHSIVSGPTMDKPAAPFVYAVPEKYDKPSTSGLTASISAGGPAQQEINFDLK